MSDMRMACWRTRWRNGRELPGQRATARPLTVSFSANTAGPPAKRRQPQESPALRGFLAFWPAQPTPTPPKPSNGGPHQGWPWQWGARLPGVGSSAFTQLYMAAKPRSHGGPTIGSWVAHCRSRKLNMHLLPLSRAARLALLGLVLSALGGLGLVALASAHDRPFPNGPADAPRPPPPPGPPGWPGGPGLQRLLDDAGANADQRTRIEELLAPVRESAVDDRMQERTDRERLMALFQAPVVDVQAVEAVRAGMARRHEAAAKQQMAALVAAANVLSLSQRQMLAAHWPTAGPRGGGPPHVGPGQDGRAPLLAPVTPAEAGASPLH